MCKIIAFHGSDHKVGTSQMAQCCSEYIAKKNPKLDILLVLADGGRGSEYCPRVHESFDSIRPYVAQSIVDGNEIKAKSKYTENLYIFGGNESPQSSEMFSPDCTEYLLEKLRNYFDLIILDSGADIDTGCCMGALFAADMSFLVLNQRESAIRRFEWMSFVYEKLDIHFSKFIVNMFNPRSPYETEYIADRLNLDPEKFINIKNCPKGLKSETDNTSLLSLKPARYFLHGIEIIAKEILSYAGINN